ncbi:hypothetical protein ILYODFUR_013598 [Ilyodon furcidens]|uniref:Uncharacterized protein n=1 Tax=Ilyodon furcidens TaxID=33524 RepID=A0ABV0SYF2_9TELE
MSNFFVFNHFSTRDNVQNHLTWAQEKKKTSPLISAPKSSFQIKFCILRSTSQSLEEKWRGTEPNFLKFLERVMFLALSSADAKCILSSPKSVQPSHQKILEIFFISVS